MKVADYYDERGMGYFIPFMAGRRRQLPLAVSTVSVLVKPVSGVFLAGIDIE